MVINIDHPQFFYDLFYQLAFVVVLVILIIEGTRLNLPLISLLLIILTTRYFSIVGSNFLALSSDEMGYFLKNLSFPENHSRNYLGALLFGVIGLIVAKSLLGIKFPILDVFALAVPFSIAVQRVGCLFAGCCFGKETDLAVGIQYGTNTPAFLHQFYAGQVNFADDLSLHVHPTPLYYIGYSLLVGIVLIRFKNYWKKPGNLALMGMSMLLFGCFLIEFFRDPMSNGPLGSSISFGIKYIQLIYLLILALLISIIAFREKYAERKVLSAFENSPTHNSIYICVFTLLLYSTQAWFSAIELSVILIVLVPAIVSVLAQIIIRYYRPSVRAGVAFLFLLSIILMAQTVPEKQISRSFRFGFSSGSFETYHNMGSGQGCDRVSQSQYFYQKYKIFGAGYAVKVIQPDLITEYGLNSYLGEHTEIGEITLNENISTIYGVNPFVKFDAKWAGIGVGMHWGALRYSPQHWVEETGSALPQTGTRENAFQPMLSVRVGKLRSIYFSYKYADHFPSPFPGLYQNLEVGSGLGLSNGFNLRLGSNLSNSMHIAAVLPISKHLAVEPLFQWGNAVSGNSSFSVNGIFSIGMLYSFEGKSKNSLK